MKALARAGAFGFRAGGLLAWTALFLALAGIARAEPPALSWPVDCTLGQSCFIQHYLDRDPGPATQDFGCGTLTYDGHDGTDIALPNAAAMAKGVAVRAAAPGVVRGMRDGVPDAAPFPEGQDCGNGVVIDSGDWQEQYCHMRQGSVAVKPGDRVAAGTFLGLVGQSGNADFPHLHLTVRQGKVPVDPFSTAATCGPGAELWASPLPYVPAGLVQIGISGGVPDYKAVQAGTGAAPETRSGALVIWAEVFGARPGDVIGFDLSGPGGVVYQGQAVLEKPQDRAYRAQGRKMQPVAGDYSGTVTLTREGKEIDRKVTSVTLR